MGQCCSGGSQITTAETVKKKPSREESAKLFKQYDANQNGQLEASELKSFLQAAFPGTQLSEKDMADFIQQFDTDKDGVIGLNELHAFLRFCDGGALKRKTALVIIDVQNDFISGTLGVPTSEHLVPTINGIRDKFDSVVISYDWHPHDHCSFVESANDGKVKLKETVKVGKLTPFTQVTLLGDADRAEHTQMLYPRHAVANGWGSECHKDLVVKASDMKVYKGQKANIDSYSAFFDNCKANDTGLTKQLEDAGVTDVYCCGLVFDICVKSSALHGAEMGFRVSVIEDGCKPLSAAEVEPTRKVLNEAGVRVISSAQAAEEAAQIRKEGQMALKEFLLKLKEHQQAASIHRGETMSSHRPQS